jgi:DNA-binding NtrC family response regulator
VTDAEVKTLVESGIATSNAQGRSPARVLICRVTSGPSAGAQIAVGARQIVLGSDAGCDLVLTDPKVSRRHAAIGAVHGGLFVRDLGSTNGTFVDSVRVTEAVAPITASIRFGSTILRASAAPVATIPPSRRVRFGGLIGESMAMREVFAVLERASPTDATVLIQGETGTGKELAARAIHDHSARAEGPFVVLDCSSTHEQLIESQLFGHKRGAFTGGVRDRKGAFLEADRGTLFIDEIGELPLEAQAMLLRALEARTVQPVGADRPVPVDTRIVAATHRDLYTMVEEGKFRGDLFHRLGVVHVLIPSLRERIDDLEPLIRGFYEGRSFDPGPIEGGVLDELRAHGWPGNVRELRNVIERAWVLQGLVPFAELRPWLAAANTDPTDVIDTHLPFKDAKEHWLAFFERRYIAAVFARYEGNISRAAEHAGINRNHFAKLLDQYGLRSS